MASASSSLFLRGNSLFRNSNSSFCGASFMVKKGRCNITSESPQDVTTSVQSKSPLSTFRHHHYSSCSCSSSRRFLLGHSIASSVFPLLDFDEGLHAMGSPIDFQNELNVEPTLKQKFFAYVMSHGMEGYEKKLKAYKEEIFSQLAEFNGEKCEIVEVGIGAAPNIHFYIAPSSPPSSSSSSSSSSTTASSTSFSSPLIHIVGVDPNGAMESYARSSADAAGLLPSQFTFLRGFGEKLPLEDECADYVIASLVLCSVDNVEQTIKEIKRILKPGGKYLFLEHIAAREGTIANVMQKVLSPLQQALADGCHLDRNPLMSIVQTFDHESSSLPFSSSVQYNVVSIPGLGFLSTHLIGSATKN